MLRRIDLRDAADTDLDYATVVPRAEFDVEHAVARVEPICTAVREEGEAALIRYTAVPLPGADVTRFEERWMQAAFDAHLRWWEDSMNHYLATGTILRHR